MEYSFQTQLYELGLKFSILQWPGEVGMRAVNVVPLTVLAFVTFNVCYKKHILKNSCKVYLRHKCGLKNYTSSRQIHTSSQEISTLCSFNNMNTCLNCIFDWLAAAEYFFWTLMIARWFFPTFFFKTAAKQSHSDHRLESHREVLAAISGWKHFQRSKKKSWKKIISN